MPPDFDRLNAAAVRAFGTAATYLPAGGGDVPIRGIFDRYYIATKPDDDGVPVSVRFSALSVRSADMPPGIELRASDQVQVGDLLFDVADPQPDGQGMTVLLLTLA